MYHIYSNRSHNSCPRIVTCKHNKVGVATIASHEQSTVRSQSMIEDVLGLVQLLIFWSNLDYSKSSTKILSEKLVDCVNDTEKYHSKINKSHPRLVATHQQSWGDHIIIFNRSLVPILSTWLYRTPSATRHLTLSPWEIVLSVAYHYITWAHYKSTHRGYGCFFSRWKVPLTLDNRAKYGQQQQFNSVS